jgi:CRISPR system Cascade subunit CasC
MHLHARLMFSVAAALPNRGGDGLAKTAPLGGSLRQRISSQCIKRALRQSATMTALAEAIGRPISVRSRIAVEAVVLPRVLAAGVAEAQARDLCAAVQDVLTRGADKAKAVRKKVADKKAKAAQAKAVQAAENGTGIEAEAAEEQAEIGVAQVVVLGHGELGAVADALVQAARDGMNGEALIEAVAKRRMPGLAAALDGSKAGLDGLLFGRMATGDPLVGLDGAVAVSHALTVHPLQDTVDYFTAVDDLDPDGGAGHLDTAHLTSGLFVLDVVTDLDLLRSSLAEQAPAVARGLLQAAMRWQPRAKVGSTAPGAELVEAAVERRERMGSQTILAFTEPVRPTPAAARERLGEWLLDRDQIEGEPMQRLWLRQAPRKDGQSAIDALAQAVEALV